MSPTSWEHGGIEMKLGGRLENFVEKHELGRVLVGEVGVYMRRDPDTVRGADILFVSNERLAQATPEGFLDVTPELIVEILSPSNRWEDVRQKISEYFAIGTGRVWMVEPGNEAVLVYRAPTEMRELKAGDVLDGAGLLDGFSVPVAELFT